MISSSQVTGVKQQTASCRIACSPARDHQYLRVRGEHADVCQHGLVRTFMTRGTRVCHSGAIRVCFHPWRSHYYAYFVIYMHGIRFKVLTLSSEHILHRRSKGSWLLVTCSCLHLARILPSYRKHLPRRVVSQIGSTSIKDHYGRSSFSIL